MASTIPAQSRQPIDLPIKINMKRIDLYNMIPNFFWSIVCLVPVSLFCYMIVNRCFFWCSLVASFLLLFLPFSFFDRIQLSSNPNRYEALGVRFVNQFAQNGDIIKRMIRKKEPSFRILSAGNTSVNKLINSTYFFEKFHFALFVFFISVTVYALVKSHIGWAFILTVSNIIYNVYPNLLQQYIRIKLKSRGNKNQG